MEIFGVRIDPKMLEICDGCGKPEIISGRLAIVIASVAVIFYILFIVAGWRIFVKAGEKGWKSIIPFYNMYIMYKIVGLKGWFWGVMVFDLAVGIIMNASGFDTTDFMRNVDVEYFDLQSCIIPLIVLLITFCFNVYIRCLCAWRTSRVFGHGIGWAVGLVFLPNIFWLMIGFGDSQYNKKILKGFIHKK